MELGLGEIIFVLIVALLVYGGRLPEVAAAVGRSLAELKRGLRDTTDSLRSDFEPLTDLDPRRTLRRAWQPPRLLDGLDGSDGDKTGTRPEITSSPGEPNAADVPVEPDENVARDDGAAGDAASANDIPDTDRPAT